MHQDLAKVKYMTRVAMVMVRTYQKLMVAMANIVSVSHMMTGLLCTRILPKLSI